MNILVTGATGYLGSYVVRELLARPEVQCLHLLTRSAGRSRPDAPSPVHKLWDAMQLHLSPEAYRSALSRIEFVAGDLHAPRLGLSGATMARLDRVDGVIHLAASLNRKSEKACLNANLRGTLSVIQLVRRLVQRRGSFHRFTYVSTTAVSGRREHECISEPDSVRWELSDYDPYGRTKKFAEHMCRELLPNVPFAIVRPPTVMGDSRMARTTQFDMLRVYSFMASLPAVPIHPATRLDFVPADFVGRAIAGLHLKPTLAWDTYHLSAGEESPTVEAHCEMLRAAGLSAPRLLPSLYPTFDRVADVLSQSGRGSLARSASLLKVFLPYFTNDVVFANDRLASELGLRPTPFTDYGAALLRWARNVNFRYPRIHLPEGMETYAEAAE